MRRDRLRISLTAHSRWWLEAIATIDEQVPGFAGEALRASEARKNIIAAALATRVSQRGFYDFRPSEQEAMDLLRLRHKRVLERAFGSCPAGFRRAVVRLKSAPTVAQSYKDLHELFANPAKRASARALMHCNSIGPQTIELAKKLPKAFARPSILEQFGNYEYDELLQVLGMARVLLPHVSEAQLQESARRLGRSRSLPKLVHSWVQSAALPSGPLPECFPYRRIDTVAVLTRTGREFRNCAASYIFKALRGQSHFYVCSIGQETAVAHLEQIAGREEYTLCHVEAPKGECLSRRADLEIERVFARHGIVRNLVPDGPDPWWLLENVYARHLHVRDQTDLLINGLNDLNIAASLV